MVWLDSMRWWDYAGFVVALAAALVVVAHLAGQWAPDARRHLLLGAAPAMALAATWSVYGQAMSAWHVTEAPAAGWRLAGTVSLEDVAYHALVVLLGPLALALVHRRLGPSGGQPRYQPPTTGVLWWALGAGCAVALIATGLTEATIGRAPEYDVALLATTVALAVLVLPQARTVLADRAVLPWIAAMVAVVTGLEWLRSHPGHTMVVTNPDEWLLPALLWPDPGKPWATPIEQVLLVVELGALAAIGWQSRRPLSGVATPLREFNIDASRSTMMDEEP